MSNESDDTLESKIPFKVYTRRWGHEDRYSIKRTVDGWYCGYIAINGKCKKNGEGGLFNNLDHDCIFYLTDWISAVEKSINAQPDWVGYY